MIRDATNDHLAGILRIHNDAVLHTNAIWEESLRTIDEQRVWCEARRAASLPVLVAIEGEEVAGFCSYGSFRARYGYRFTVESSVYVASEHQRKGVARRLMSALIDRARAQSLHVMIAGIEAQNAASIRLHEQLGFAVAAHVHEVGYKFGRWLDLVLMELRL